MIILSQRVALCLVPLDSAPLERRKKITANGLGALPAEGSLEATGMPDQAGVVPDTAVQNMPLTNK